MTDESNAPENIQDNAAPEANPLEAELAKMRDTMLRALADAENTRRRSEKQAQEARVYAIDRFARDLLPVADTLGRALQAISPEARQGADEATRTLLDGIELTERSLIETFARHGLKRVGAKGDAFDPNLHQAVAQAPSEHPANTVIEVLQPGYVLGDRTVRAAMVMVSAGRAATAPEAGAGVDIKV